MSDAALDARRSRVAEALSRPFDNRLIFNAWSDVRYVVWRLTRIELPHPGMRDWPR